MHRLTHGVLAAALTLTLTLALTTLLPAAAQDPAQDITLPSLSCSRGPLAVQLPRHYPSLHAIGRHTVTDLETRAVAGGSVTLRRIEYIGLRLDLQRASATPDAYEIVALEVWSRRWELGALSVGRALRAAVDGPALRHAPDNGRVALRGPEAVVELQLRNGRIERAHWRCGRGRD